MLREGVIDTWKARYRQVTSWRKPTKLHRCFLCPTLKDMVNNKGWTSLRKIFDAFIQVSFCCRYPMWMPSTSLLLFFTCRLIQLKHLKFGCSNCSSINQTWIFQQRWNFDCPLVLLKCLVLRIAQCWSALRCLSSYRGWRWLIIKITTVSLSMQLLLKHPEMVESVCSS